MAILDLHRKDTICAASTALSPSAIAVVRVSGANAIAIKEQIFRPKKKAQKFFVATLGDVLDIDEAVCVMFPEGKSYTGESSFELSLHGSPIIVRSVLALLEERGCRLAEPGEFSMRAVLNKKMDLCAAEAVCDLISAQSEKAARVALQNVKGSLSKYLEPTRINIIDMLAEIESRLDFPDEDIGEARREEILLKLDNCLASLRSLLDSSTFGLKLTEGARVVLYGLPNAGKSTLLNVLLKEERALVHHLPGTTRDVVEAPWVVGGVPVQLVDVAGIRKTDDIDVVEALGIQKAKKELEKADVVLWLQDCTTAETEDLLSENLSKDTPVLKVFTKADLLPEGREKGTCISAKTGQGLNDLEKMLSEVLVQEESAASEVLLTRKRQKVEVENACQSLESAKEAFVNNSVDEVFASELRCAGQDLDSLLGGTLSEDVLDLIFSRFCIGK